MRDARAQFDENVDVSKVVPTNTMTRERVQPSERPPVPRPRQTSVRPVLKSVDRNAQPKAAPPSPRSSSPPPNVADPTAEAQRSVDDHVRTLTGLPAPHPNPQRDFPSLHERSQMNRQPTAIAFPAPPHLSPAAPSVGVAAAPPSSLERPSRQRRAHFANVPAVVELDEDGTRPAARGRAPQQSGLLSPRRALAFCGFLVLGCAVSWYLSSAYLNGDPPTRPEAPVSGAPAQRSPVPPAAPTVQNPNSVRPDNTGQRPPARPATQRPTEASAPRAASHEAGQNTLANSARTTSALPVGSSPSSTASGQKAPPARSASGPTLPFGARLASPED